VGPFLGRFYFYAQTLQTMSKGCFMSKYQSIWTASSWEDHLKKFTQFYPFFPLIGPLDFHKFKSPFPKDASYQIWFKSVQWFWRRSCLKEKFRDRRRTGHDHYIYSSLELKMPTYSTWIHCIQWGWLTHILDEKLVAWIPWTLHPDPFENLRSPHSDLLLLLLTNMKIMIIWFYHWFVK